MKEITLSASRVQYFPNSCDTHPCKSLTLTGEEARTAVKSSFSGLLNHLKSIKDKRPSSDLSLPTIKAAEERYHNVIERLKVLDEMDLKVTIISPLKQWLA